MARPRSRTSLVTSPTSTESAAAIAAYSPTLWPITTSGFTFSLACTARSAASDAVTSAGWVMSVSESRSIGPSKHTLRRSKSTSAEASSNTALASGNALAISRPMPTRWLPCPGKQNATLFISSPSEGVSIPSRTSPTTGRRRSPS